MSKERQPSTRTPTHEEIPPAARAPIITPPEPTLFDAQDTWEIAFLLALAGSAREPYPPEKNEEFIGNRAERIADLALERITRRRKVAPHLPRR